MLTRVSPQRKISNVWTLEQQFVTVKVRNNELSGELEV